MTRLADLTSLDAPGAPNLDAQTEDWLMSFWHVATTTEPVRLARILFPDRPKGYVTATRDLGHYASNKATAQRCRLAGRIERALCYEDIADGIYANLPTFARW